MMITRTFGFLGLVLLLCLAVKAEGPATQAVPSGANAYTMRQYREAALAFRRSEMVDAYQRLGKHDPKWDAAASALLDRVARKLADVDEDATWADAVVAGKPAVDAGCDDPMVLYGYARALEEADRVAEAVPFYVRVVEAFPSTRYPRGPLAFAASSLRFNANGAMDPPTSLRYRDLAFLTYTQLPGDELYLRNRRELLAELQRYLQHLDPKRHAVFVAGLREVKGADAWVVDVLSGQWSRIKARMLSPGGQEESAEARKCLMRAAVAEPGYPEAATELIMLKNVDGAPDDRRAWFDRAVAAQMDWDPAYSAMLTALYPKNGGSWDNVLDFGRECLATGRFDTDVPLYFYHAVALAANDPAGTQRDLWADPKVYPDVRHLFETLASETSRSESRRNYFRSMHAVFAYRTGRFIECRAVLEKLGQRLVAQALREQNVDPDRMLSEAYARSGPLAKDLSAADDAFTVKNYNVAAAFYASAAGRNTDPRADAFIRGRLGLARAGKDFKEGRWAELPLERGLPGWTIGYGNWMVEQPGTVIEDMPPRSKLPALRHRGGPQLLYDAVVGARVEIEFEAERGSFENGMGLNTIGVIFNSPEGAGLPCWSFSADGLFQKGHIEPVMPDGSIYPGRVFSVPARQTSKFRLLVWDNEVSIYCDDRLVCARATLPTKGLDPAVQEQMAAAPKRIGIGRTSGSSQPNRYRHLRVRRLDRRPDEPELDVFAALTETQRLVDRGRFDEAGRVVGGVDPKPLNDDLRGRVRRGATSARLCRTLADGRSADLNALLPDAKDWAAEGGQWSIRDRVIEGRVSADACYFYPDLELGNFEAEYELSVTGAAAGQVGLVFWKVDGIAPAAAMFVSFADGKLSFRPLGGGRGEPVPTNFDGSHLTLRVRVEHGEFWVSVNGKEVMGSAPIVAQFGNFRVQRGTGAERVGRIGIGGQFGDSRPTLRVTRFSVRTLPPSENHYEQQDD